MNVAVHGSLIDTWVTNQSLYISVFADFLYLSVITEDYWSIVHLNNVFYSNNKYTSGFQRSIITYS